MISVFDCTHLIETFLPEPHAGLLAGIVFGTKMSLDSSLKQALTTTGTLHIIALSGMNITIIANLVNSSLLWIVPRRLAGIVTIGCIVFFIWFVGPSASIVRAGIMGGISIIGVWSGRERFALWSWGIAVVLMLILHPVWITELSFQLSALASLGMILFGVDSSKKAYIQRSWLQSGKEIIVDGLHTTLSAQVFTIPLLFFTFGRLSLISPLTNILIVWVVPIVTVLGFLMVCLGAIWLPLGQIVSWVTWVFLEYMIQIIFLTSRLPFASIGM
jgi:competence protein ComEC